MWRTPTETASRMKRTCSGAVVRRLVPRPMRGTSTPASRSVLTSLRLGLRERLVEQLESPLELLTGGGQRWQEPEDVAVEAAGDEDARAPGAGHGLHQQCDPQRCPRLLVERLAARVGAYAEAHEHPPPLEELIAKGSRLRGVRGLTAASGPLMWGRPTSAARTHRVV